MHRQKNKLVILVFAVIGYALANPFNHIYENFKTEPAEFMFNSSIVILLLTVGGILAGKTFNFLAKSIFFRPYYRLNDA